MIKKFLSYFKPHIGMLILDLLAAILIAVCNLFYPVIAKNIINDYVFDETPKMLIIFSIALLGIYIVKACCTFFVSYYGHVMGIKIQKDMRRDLFRKYESLPTTYFDNNKTGDLLSRLVNDLFEVSELAHHGPENLLLASLMFIGSFAVLSTIDLTLTAIMFSIVPFIVLFTFLSRRGMHKAMKASRKQTSVINSTVENSISGIRETKAYVAEHHEIEKFDTMNGLLAKYRTGAMFAMGRFETVMSFLSDLLYLVVIFVGGLFLFEGRIDAGEFTAFVLYIGMFLTPIQKFVALFQQLEEGMTGFSRFYDIMNEVEEVDDGEIELDQIQGEVVFDGVSFAYESSENEAKYVINDLNLSVKAGQTLALVGPSGGGKSTLCNLIPRYYDVSSGKISIDGTDIRDIKLSSLRSHIGIVSQDVFLFDGTIKENIAYGNPEATDEEIAEAARRANIHDYISTLDSGYDTEVGERGIKLSGGQKQRVAIARVFLKNPSLLILDEATSALDNVTEMQIQKALEELSAGRTVIVVAHRLSTVKNADEIVVIDADGVVERGTHTELLALGGEYKKLYTHQFSEVTD
jgi:ATP-binding cassette subfamily B protein